MLGRILFAWKLSFRLDADAKTWRFAADILNDAGTFVELITPLLPRGAFIPLACFATLLKSLCGVAAGSTKAALSQHFAINDNMADLAAKDGSQETILGLVGMLAGSVLVQIIPDESLFWTWATFIAFTILHLWFNYW
ncbi:hypothetical protein HK104_002346 [Borealophlyctis nickersoniae]|nr:hypothetical protein HK104_002346 [Borealophlyctis nickersoniae]